MNNKDGINLRSIPMRKKVTMKMVAREMARELRVSSHMVRYCS